MTDPPPHRVAVVRRATAEDATAIASLRDEALAELAPLRGGLLYAAADLPEVSDRERPLWAGLVDGAVVGYLSGRVEERLGKVDAIYVDARCRAVGVGEAMMASALEWFRASDCIGVDAIALPGARATKNFFEESGFTARLLIMHRPLG